MAETMAEKSVSWWVEPMVVSSVVSTAWIMAAMTDYLKAEQKVVWTVANLVALTADN